MTQPAVNSEQVTALFAERQQYESWLSTLEAKRATTPAHIYDRVRADYAARLQRVNEQLATHHAALQALESSLAERLAALDVEEARCRDEAAEVELRALVGELSPEHQREVTERTQAALATVTEERAKVGDELTRLRTILEAAAPSAAQVTAAQEPTPVAPAASEAPTTPPETAPAPEAAGDEHDSQPQPATPAAPAAADDWQLAFEQTPEPRAASGSTQSVPPAPVSGSGAAERTPEPGPFDDLEFLKSMIEPRAAPQPATRASAPDSAPRATDLAPISEQPAEQPKTLRCQECSTLNYPTEWYCERCGAELAAL